MKAEIISIGTELLLGKITDTNSQFLSNALSKLGIDVFYRQTVGDNPRRLIECLNIAARRADLIITIGGLGPTVDDITIKSTADFLKLDLIQSKYVINQLEKYFKLRGISLPPDNIKQAVIPKGSIIFKNTFGTAPGILTKKRNYTVLMLPGPPNELIPMFEKYIFRYLKKIFSPKLKIASKTLKLAGIPESVVNNKVRDLLLLSGPVTLGIYATSGEVHLVITVKADSEKALKAFTEPLRKTIHDRLGNFIFGEDSELIEEVVGKLLKKHKLKISIAESATGGLISSRITDIPGSSDYFMSGFIVYSNESKIKILGVKKNTLARFGSISGETASEMAKNARLIGNSDIGISITGIAGPRGACPGKPLGTHYIGLFNGKNMFVKKSIFTGTRQMIKMRASEEVLTILWRYLKSL